MIQEERTAQIDPIQMSEKELNEHLEKGTRYVVSGKRAYYIAHVNYKPDFIPFYGRLVFCWGKPQTKQGLYIVLNADGMNRLIGQQLFTD